MTLCLLTGLFCGSHTPLHAADLPTPVNGVLTITVSAEGEFNSNYTVADIRATGATRLKVIGPLNNNDINRVANVFISSSSIDIRQLDLSEAVFTTMPESSFYIASNYGTCYLTEIVLPEGLTAIPSSCFSGCRLLSSVNIPSTVTLIGSSAFNSCSSLPATLVINVSGPLDIESGVYSNGVALTTISITAGGDVSLGDNYYTKPFTSNQLTTFELHTPGKLITCNEMFTYATGTLLTATLDARGEGSILGTQIFKNCKKLTSVTLPTGLTDIPQECFEECTSLENLTIPSSVATIGEQAFYGCTSLGALDLSQTQLTTIGQEAFRGCTAITSMPLPDGITSVGVNAFRNCSLLTALDLSGATMTEIPNSMCEGCIALSSIQLPATVTSIGSWAFYNCKALTSLDLSQMSFTAIPLKMCYGCELLSTLRLPADYTSIGEGAFYQCAALTTFDIPSTVTSIGLQAFYQCSNLQAITIPESVTEMGTEIFYQCTALTTASVQANVATLPSSTFSGCSALTTATLNDHITELGGSCFSSCWSLAGITLPSNLTTIGSSCFSSCSALNRILLPTTLTSIGSNAFRYCTNLTMLEVPEGITQIPFAMLEGCSRLQSLYLPSTITEIGEKALRMQVDDYNSVTLNVLVDVHVAATTPPTVASQRVSYSKVTLYVPEASIADYAAANFWSDFRSVLAEQTNLSTLDDTDYALLQTLYTEMGGSNWTTTWTFGATKAETTIPYGVKVNDGHVVQLLLNNNNLSGTLTTTLMQFPNLWYINVSGNQISGPVENLFDNIAVNSALTYLDLSDNLLTGNLGAMTRVGAENTDLLPNLSTLKAARNNIRDVKPQLPSHIYTLDIDGQQLLNEVNPVTQQPFTFSDFMDANEETMQSLFPTIMIYYFPYTSYNIYRYENFALMSKDSSEPWAVNLYKRTNSPSSVSKYRSSISTWNYDAQNTTIYLCSYVRTESTPNRMLLTFDFMMGDVNYDNAVNVSDLQKLINLAIRPESADTSTPFNFYAANTRTADDADVRTIDVLDVIAEVNLLLDQDITQSFARRNSAHKSYEAHKSHKTYETHQATLTIENGQLVLNTEEPVAALDLSVSGSVEWDSALSLFTRKSRGSRTIFYSLMGDVLPAGRTVLGTVGSDANIEAVQLCNIEGQFIATSFEDSETTGVTSVATESQQTSSTFDLQGRRIDGSLKKGVYITNGKKVIK